MCRCFDKILSKFSTSCGFTLIELMMALLLFAIGMLAITAMCLMSISGNSLVNRMTQANFLAQSKMEEVLSKRNLADLAVGNHSDPPPGGNYTRDWSVTADADGNRWVILNVGWTDSRGNHQVELKTLVVP